MDLNMNLSCPVCGQPQPSLAILNAHLDAEHFAPPGAANVVASWLKKAASNAKDGFKDLKLGGRTGTGAGTGTASSPQLLGLGTTPSPSPSTPGTRQPSFNFPSSASSPNLSATPQIRTPPPVSPPPPPPPPAPPTPSPSSQVQVLPTTTTPPPPTFRTLRVASPSYKPPDPISHTDLFRALRATHPKRDNLDRLSLESNKLEGRYRRLFSIWLEGKRVKEREKEVVPWQDDKKAVSCAVCGQFFSFSNRKHHCRLGGECICAAPTCSVGLPLVGDFLKDDLERDRIGETRACSRCLELLMRLRKPSFRDTTAKQDPLVGLYSEMAQLRKDGERKLAEFNTTMVKLSAKPIDEADPDYVKAQGLRKEITACFARYDALSKQIATLPLPLSTFSVQYKKLCTNIRAAAVAFLQNNLFTLQLLPSPRTSSPSPSLLLDPSVPVQSAASLAKIAELNALYSALAAQREALEGQLRETEGQRALKEDRETLLSAWKEVGGEMARVERELAGLVV